MSIRRHSLTLACLVIAQVRSDCDTFRSTLRLKRSRPTPTAKKKNRQSVKRHKTDATLVTRADTVVTASTKSRSWLLARSQKPNTLRLKASRPPTTKKSNRQSTKCHETVGTNAALVTRADTVVTASTKSRSWVLAPSQKPNTLRLKDSPPSTSEKRNRQSGKRCEAIATTKICKTVEANATTTNTMDNTTATPSTHDNAATVTAVTITPSRCIDLTSSPPNMGLVDLTSPVGRGKHVVNTQSVSLRTPISSNSVGSPTVVNASTPTRVGRKVTIRSWMTKLVSPGKRTNVSNNSRASASKTIDLTS